MHVERMYVRLNAREIMLKIEEKCVVRYSINAETNIAVSTAEARVPLFLP